MEDKLKFTGQAIFSVYVQAQDSYLVYVTNGKPCGKCTGVGAIGNMEEHWVMPCPYCFGYGVDSVYVGTFEAPETYDEKNKEITRVLDENSWVLSKYLGETVSNFKIMTVDELEGGKIG